MEVKLGVVVADIWIMIAFKLMIPLNSWFCIVFLQILKVVVYELAMISFISFPAEQFGLSEVSYLPYPYFSIHFSAPTLRGSPGQSTIFFCHHCPMPQPTSDWSSRQQHTHNICFSFPFWIWSFRGCQCGEEYPTLSNVLSVLLSLLLHQKYESIVEGSEHILS